MPKDILADVGPVADAARLDHWQTVWNDLNQLMSATEAAERLGIQQQIIVRAVKRGEITPYQFSKGRIYVTPRIVAEWAENYCRIPQATQLPS